MLRYILVTLAFIFFATSALAAEVRVVVDISDQLMRVSVDGEQQYKFAVSTGRKGYATPKGSYGITRMHEKYHSKKYDGAPMPYAIFFHGGYAIHGTNDIKRLGRVASHGCVRLAPQNARKLYNLVLDYGRDNVSIQVKA